MRHCALLISAGTVTIGDLDYFERDIQILPKEFPIKDNCFIYEMALDLLPPFLIVATFTVDGCPENVGTFIVWHENGLVVLLCLNYSLSRNPLASG